MRICLMIEGQEDVTWEQWLALADACDTHGIEALFRSDHYSSVSGRRERGSLDAWATLAGLAARTTSVRLGTLVSPATFRHPSVLARMATTVDHISGGRVEVGMGAGWYDRDHSENGFPFLDARSRFELFAEQVEIVVRTWTEESFDHEGAHYTLRRQTALPRPVQQPHPPLVLGGRAKPRAAALAARFATEYNTLGAPLDELRERRRRLDDACATIGRDPSTLAYSLMTRCVIGQGRGERDERALIGSVEELAERLGELESIGISRVMLQHLDHADLDAVGAMGELAAATR